MKYKLLLVCALAIASMATVQAAEITVSGNTTGSFSATGNSTNGHLSFTGTAFTGTTSGGFAGFTLGQLSLVGGPQTFTGQSFTLTVTFTAPPTTGPNPGTFTATLTGSVNSTGNGGVNFNFANDFLNPQTFTFNGGSFQFYVDDVTVGGNKTGVDLTGGVLGATTIPDGGSTVALLGMAMVGAAALRRKLGL
jgi:hypothetical protein